MVKPRRWFGREVVLVPLLLALLGRASYGFAVSGRSDPLRWPPGSSGNVLFHVHNGTGGQDMKVRVCLVRGREIAALVDPEPGPDGAVEFDLPYGAVRDITIHIAVPEQGYQLEYTIELTFSGAPLGGMFGYAIDRSFSVEVHARPVAASDEYSVAENSVLQVPAPGVLGNDTDSDPRGRALEAALVTGVSHGRLTLNVVDGSFTYTPNANFIGTDSFTYRATDGVSGSDAVAVTITVGPVNHSPLANAGGPYVVSATSWDGAVVLLDGTNSSDPDGDELSHAWAVGGTTIGPESTVEWQFPIGETEVTLTVTDPDGASATDTTTVTVRVTEVAIDIKPGSYPNSINLGAEGVVPVAILTTPDFDAASVDEFSLTLSGSAVRLKGKSDRAGSLEDVDGDGDLDLVVQFSINELALQEGATEAVLEGVTLDGTPIVGYDSVRVVP